MSNLKRLKSYSDYKKDMGKSTPEPTPTPSISESKLHKSVVTKQRMVKESAFKVGDDYKVKVTFDIPVSLISAYIEKVKTDTGKNALEHFSESELAEQMAQYILKQNLNIDQLPAALSVGEDPNTNPDEVQPESEGDSATLDAEFGDVPSGETAEPGIESATEEAPANDIDINDSDLSIDKDEEGEDIDLENDEDKDVEEGEDIDIEDSEPATEEAPTEAPAPEPTEEDQDEKEIDLNSDEVNLGEEREIKKTEEQEEEYEEITLDDEETINDIDGVLTSATMPVKDMMFYLKHHGIDCSACSDEEVVDIYNEITHEHTIGVDDDGNEVKPNSASDDDNHFGNINDFEF